MAKSFDPDFYNPQLQKVAEYAVTHAKQLGCSYCDFRYEKIKDESIALRDTTVEAVTFSEGKGYAIRLIYNKTWGFASGTNISEAEVLDVLKKAIAMAKHLSEINQFPVELAKEPIHDAEYFSDYEINPFDVPLKTKIAYMLDIAKRLKDSDFVDYVNFASTFIEENKFFFSSEGTKTIQQRIRAFPEYDITAIDKSSGGYITLASSTYPVGMGYEVFQKFDMPTMAEESPLLLKQKMDAESITPGRYDLVIDPTNLWLTIHESIGHATELDRVLGYEANYAGTSFATLDKRNNLQYGSKYINIQADRTQRHGLATIGYDDEGVQTKNWMLIEDGILKDYQYNSEIAKRYDFGSSNGCAFADSPENVPIQRMPNVSLLPSKEKISTEDLFAHVTDGIYIVGNNSWSIDMQRYNFQFTGQLFYKIKNGKIDGMYKDVAYQSNTVDFWNACDKIGGEETYVLCGALNCGKGQPGQVAPVSHGAPSAAFRNINILNTQNENKLA